VARPVIRSKITSFRAFLAAEAGGTGIEFTIIAAAVGLAMALPLYLVGGMLTEKFELIASALKRQNN
jgi:Flp pilus assembly pilin Flp